VVEKKLIFNKKHQKLNLNYRVVENDIEFEDGVIYKNREIAILRDVGTFDYKTIHLAKKIFNGEVVE
jgi:hypothetical protein